MSDCILVGVDLHDRSMVLSWAVGRGEARSACYANDRAGRKAMIECFGELAAGGGGGRVTFAYEASGQGFGLYDELCEAGLDCHVLAPTKMPGSAKGRRQKTDKKDAARILDILRAHVLAGCQLPGVWVPDRQCRDDREVVRARLDLSGKLTVLKNQVRTLLKRNGVGRPASMSRCWTQAYRAWLRGLVGGGVGLGAGAQVALRTLLAQMEVVQEQMVVLDREVASLSGQERHREPAGSLTELRGVGLLTAMVFLVEMGTLSRFGNRRQVGSYVGLAPSSNESGESGDRKGHITRQGPSRVRRALCQATWSRIRTDPHERMIYERICRKNPGHKKKGVVALMRRLAVRMWHVGLAAQSRTQQKAA